MSGHFIADLPPKHQEMCNTGAKDNLGQVADFIRLGIGATVCKCPHPGAGAMNDRAASGSNFNSGEVGMRPVPGIASGSNVMRIFQVVDDKELWDAVVVLAAFRRMQSG
jgi:hypothetical protein